ncbi:MAG TPA: phage tail protein [Aquabacterium sp.]|nr:phage tail protein [Aquabacterium sp.]
MTQQVPYSMLAPDVAAAINAAVAAAGPQPGDLKPTAASAAPSGWLLCDGSAVSRTTYAALFAAVGTTFGAGDGSTTFNLPNGAGRGFIGAGTPTTTEVVTSQAASGNAIPVASNNTKWITGMAVTVSGASGFTGLTNGTWYIVRPAPRCSSPPP